MDVTSNSRSRTGANAANADASRMRAQKQRAKGTEAADRRDNARTARVRAPERGKDTYDPGAGARVVRARPSPDAAAAATGGNNPRPSKRGGRA